LKGDESDSIEEDEPKEEEPKTPFLKRLIRDTRKPIRYTTSIFHYSCILYITNDDPRTVREVVVSEYSKL